MNGHEAWLQRLYSLATRFSACGACADMANLSSADLWGVYRYLSRIADGA